MLKDNKRSINNGPNFVSNTIGVSSSQWCAGLVRRALDQRHMTRFAQNLPVQRVAAVLVGLRRQKDAAHLRERAEPCVKYCWCCKASWASGHFVKHQMFQRTIKSNVPVMFAKTEYFFNESGCFRNNVFTTLRECSNVLICYLGISCIKISLHIVQNKQRTHELGKNVKRAHTHTSQR